VYDPYGQVTILAPNWSTRGNSTYAWLYFHQGGRFDSASSLYQYRDRDYSPSLGRWIQQDPIELAAGDNNLYRYCKDTPATTIDPSGLWSWTGGNRPVHSL